ncbi:hypothetical protein VPNG_01531 [Cytospora leucostoma]|uniref:CFEM domain-containing protein n=1 Tax=Cytospora leucostoma TaxID=1230097 RepID=A0A423XJX6_9PEZI|nr:hypothetical protein VPNG_01531 [Cytospora leucostoma]
MLFTIFLSTVLAGLSVAQYSGLPSCAESCAAEQFQSGSYAGCGTNPKCICSNQDFLGTISCCLVDACDAADQAKAITFAQAICQANGVTVASTASCSTAAASSTASGSAASTSASTTATGTAGSSTSTADSAASGGATSSGSAAGTAASTSASKAWAPRETSAVGLSVLGGLAAAGLALL